MISKSVLVEQSKERIRQKFFLIVKESGLKVNFLNKQDDEKKNFEDKRSNFEKKINFEQSSIKHEEKEEEKTRVEKETRGEEEIKINILKAEKKLKLKDEEIDELCRMKSKIEIELEDLTASLFEEAYKMVSEAKLEKIKAEKELKEIRMKNEVLLAEVKALKLMISKGNSKKKNLISSLHSSYNSKLKKVMKKNNGLMSVFLDQNVNDQINKEEISADENDENMNNEMDVVYWNEFIEWKKILSLEKEDSQFMKRLYEEEIDIILNLNGNVKLNSLVLSAIKMNNIIIEKINVENEKEKCALMMDMNDQVYQTDPNMFELNCKYKIKIDEDWYNICKLCRDRTSAMCDLFCYLRYIKEGLIRTAGMKEIYWEIIRRRRKIALARLGLSES